ncbi:MAG: hypothetical protein JSU68_04660, partial [Phycisphaerales bacterium]
MLLLVGGLLVGRWYLGRRSVAWHVRRGLELLAGAATPGEVRAALRRWEDETRAGLQIGDWGLGREAGGEGGASRREKLIGHLLNDYGLDDQRIRLLLTRIAGADYGDRRADWQRWFATRQRLRAGLQPRVPRRQSIKLEDRW